LIKAFWDTIFKMAFGRGNERNRGGDDKFQMDFIVLIGFIIMALATFFQIAGLASDHWVDTVTEDYGTVGYNGLWHTCTNFGLTKDSCRGFQWTDPQVSRKLQRNLFNTIMLFLPFLTSLIYM
jgi:hypothetical protein